MAKMCEVCGKAPVFGNRVSHAHNVSSRRWMPNLQRVRAVVNGKVQMRPIKTSGTRRDLLIVIDGLVGSETLVARPPESLADGTAVRVKGA